MDTVQNYSNNRQVGVIAQEVQAVLPEIVGNVTKEFLGVDYAFLTPLLIEGVKELDANAKDNRNRVEELKDSSQERDRVVTEMQESNRDRDGMIEEMRAELAELRESNKELQETKRELQELRQLVQHVLARDQKTEAMEEDEELNVHK